MGDDQNQDCKMCKFLTAEAGKNSMKYHMQVMYEDCQYVSIRLLGSKSLAHLRLITKDHIDWETIMNRMRHNNNRNRKDRKVCVKVLQVELLEQMEQCALESVAKIVNSTVPSCRQLCHSYLRKFDNEQFPDSHLELHVFMPVNGFFFNRNFKKNFMAFKEWRKLNEAEKERLGQNDYHDLDDDDDDVFFTEETDNENDEGIDDENGVDSSRRGSARPSRRPTRPSLAPSRSSMIRRPTLSAVNQQGLGIRPMGNRLSVSANVRRASSSSNQPSSRNSRGSIFSNLINKK